MIFDGLPAHAADADLVVIGAGPAGLALALAAHAGGLRVLVLEAGPGPSPQAQIDDPRRHAALEVAARRGPGGTSAWWGGRLVPLDPVDFLPRFADRDALWPIGATDLAAYEDKAVAFFGLQPAPFTAAEPLPGWPGSIETRALERWCPQIDMWTRHRHRFADRGGPDIATGVTVTGLVPDGSGRIGTLRVRSGGADRNLPVRRVAVAAGGLGSTQLLLASQRAHPALFGGAEGPLGRAYMGHISGKIASIALASGADARALDFFRGADGAYMRRRLTFPESVMEQNGLLNTSFWIDNPPFYDAAHGDGLLSLVFLALKFPPIGRRLLPEGVRLAHIGENVAIPPHVRNVLTTPFSTTAATARMLRERYLMRPRKPGFIVANPGHRYALHYHAEQMPDRDSRVMLADGFEPSGLPRLRIDLRYSAADAASVVKAHALLDESMQASGRGRLIYKTEEANRHDSVLAQAADGYHQLGTTRMGASPGTSVVDRDLRVHGLANLYVAASSTFPTSGQANPTFSTVALALRLAHHLTKASA